MPREKYTRKQRLFRAMLGEVLQAERLRTATRQADVAEACGYAGVAGIARAERVGCGLHVAHEIANAVCVPLWVIIKRAEELCEHRWAEIERAGGALGVRRGGLAADKRGS